MRRFLFVDVGAYEWASRFCCTIYPAYLARYKSHLLPPRATSNQTGANFSIIGSTSTGRKCEGYSSKEPASASSKSDLGVLVNLPQLLLVGVAGNQQERRAFHFFQQRTAPHLSGFYNDEFWNQMVLRASHQEPAIRHAVMALGSLHGAYDQNLLLGYSHSRVPVHSFAVLFLG